MAKEMKRLSEKAYGALTVLKDINTGTMDQINAQGAEVVSGHFTALRSNGFVSTEKIDIACELCGNVKKGITVYTITEAGLAYVQEPLEA